MHTFLYMAFNDAIHVTYKYTSHCFLNKPNYSECFPVTKLISTKKYIIVP